MFMGAMLAMVVVYGIGFATYKSSISVMWVKHRAIFTTPLLLVYTTYKNGDDWGMVSTKAGGQAISDRHVGETQMVIRHGHGGLDALATLKKSRKV